jgi:hypothetical protein
MVGNQPASAVMTQTNVLNTQSLIIQGANCTSGSANVASIIALYPIQNTTYWNVNMTVVASGAGGTATYTIYYYGLS